MGVKVGLLDWLSGKLANPLPNKAKMKLGKATTTT